jgi:hypothetical protein
MAAYNILFAAIFLFSIIGVRLWLRRKIAQNILTQMQLDEEKHVAYIKHENDKK